MAKKERSGNLVLPFNKYESLESFFFFFLNESNEGFANAKDPNGNARMAKKGSGNLVLPCNI